MPVNDKKRAYGSKLVEYIETYKAIFIVGVDNVGSRQMQQVRAARARALRWRGAVRRGRRETAAAAATARGSEQQCELHCCSLQPPPPLPPRVW